MKNNPRIGKKLYFEKLKITKLDDKSRSKILGGAIPTIDSELIDIGTGSGAVSNNCTYTETQQP